MWCCGERQVKGDVGGSPVTHLGPRNESCVPRGRAKACRGRCVVAWPSLPSSVQRRPGGNDPLPAAGPCSPQHLHPWPFQPLFKPPADPRNDPLHLIINLSCSTGRALLSPTLTSFLSPLAASTTTNRRSVLGWSPAALGGGSARDTRDVSRRPRRASKDGQRAAELLGLAEQSRAPELWVRAAGSEQQGFGGKPSCWECGLGFGWGLAQQMLSWASRETPGVSPGHPSPALPAPGSSPPRSNEGVLLPWEGAEAAVWEVRISARSLFLFLPFSQLQ